MHTMESRRNHQFENILQQKDKENRNEINIHRMVNQTYRSLQRERIFSDKTKQFNFVKASHLEKLIKIL